MSPNEKHAATYHGGEYTPDTSRVRHSYVDHVDYSAQLHGLPSNDKDAGEAFDRWLDRVRAEAKAEALNDFAKVIDAEERDQWISDGLHRPGAQIVAQRMKVLGKVARTRANQFKLGSE